MSAEVIKAVEQTKNIGIVVLGIALTAGPLVVGLLVFLLKRTFTQVTSHITDLGLHLNPQVPGYVSPSDCHQTRQEIKEDVREIKTEVKADMHGIYKRINDLHDQNNEQHQNIMGQMRKLNGGDG